MEMMVVIEGVTEVDVGVTSDERSVGDQSSPFRYAWSVNPERSDMVNLLS